MGSIAVYYLGVGEEARVFHPLFLCFGGISGSGSWDNHSYVFQSSQDSPWDVPTPTRWLRIWELITLSSLHSIHPNGGSSFLLFLISGLLQYFMWLPTSSTLCSQSHALNSFVYDTQSGFHFPERLLTDTVLGTRNGNCYSTWDSGFGLLFIWPWIR